MKIAEKGFEHLTLNTGHTMFQTLENFPLDTVVNARLKKLTQEALSPEGAAIIGDITFEVVKESDCYMGTLFSNSSKGKCPILTTGGAKTEEAGKKVWAMLQKCLPKDEAVMAMRQNRPRAPFVADLIHNCCFHDAQAVAFFMSGISGDFCKCMGWAYLFPEVIAEDKTTTRSEDLEELTADIKMENPTNPGYPGIELYSVGTKMPVPVMEGMQLEFDGGFMLRCIMNRPTAKEKRAFKSGVPQFGLAVVDGVIFFLARFGTLNWMDAPFNIHLYPDNRKLLLETPGPTQGYGLHVMLIDGATGILVHQKLIGLDHDLSMRLRDAIINQPEIPNYNQHVQSIMARYSTNDLVALESGHPVSKAQNDTSTSGPQLRPSHKGFVGIKKDNYPLPEELYEFNYFYPDGTGHVVMAIPELLLPKAIKSGNYDDYECPVPCRYILAKGYRFHEGYVVCDVPYNKDWGVDIDESWYDE